MPDLVPYTQLVPPGWQLPCVVCGRRLTTADWQAKQVAAVGDNVDGVHTACCLSHLLDGPDGPEYRRTIKRMAAAVARQVQEGGNAN